MRINASGTDMYLHNAHGDVVQTVNQAGDVTNLPKTDAFGVGAAIKFSYAGEYMDGETGFVYLRNRYYNSATGNFITEDPIRDGANWYGYCGGDPVNRIDLWGLKYIPLRSTIEDLGGSISWKSDLGVAIAHLDGKNAGFYAGDEHGSYIQDNTMFVWDEDLFSALAITFDLGKGWTGRIERDSSGG